MYSVHGHMVFHMRFPHSEICGSKDICSSPQLIAACHVLLRLPVPRHSPCALISLDFFKSSNLVLKFVASLHANRKSFEVFPLPFTFVMILLRIYLFYGKTFNNLNIIKNLPVSVVYAFFNTRIRSICFLLFIFQCSFSALNTDQHNIYPYIAFITI